jgi:AI-2 transport protein TqsA
MNTNFNETQSSQNKKDTNLKHIRTLLSLLLVIAVMAVCKITGEVSITLLLSIFIFILVLPFVNALEKAKLPSWLATIMAVLLIIVLMLAFVWFVFYTVDVLVRRIPTYASKLDDLDNFIQALVSKWVDLPDDFSIFNVVQIDWVGGVVMPMLKSISSSAVSIVSNALVTILMTVFLLLERHTLIPKLSYAVNYNRKQQRKPIFADDDYSAQEKKKEDEQDEKVQKIWDRINKQVSKYIGIKTIVSIITGLMFYIVAKSVGLDFAFLWGVLATVLNFIPTIGSIVITVLTIFMAIIQFLPNWTPILVVAAGTILTENIIGNFIDPRLQGNQLNLSPFVILVALSIFGYVWGIVGMFLAVPLLSVLQIVFANMDETRPIAMLISSGHSFNTEVQGKVPRKNHKKKHANDPSEEGDIFFPEK